MFSKTDNATDTVMDVIADAMKILVQGIAQDGEVVKGFEALAELAEKIATCPNGLPEGAISDLSL
eukprot:3198829-Prorocentrum_lima.AAC.1